MNKFSFANTIQRPISDMRVPRVGIATGARAVHVGRRMARPRQVRKESTTLTGEAAPCETGLKYALVVVSMNPLSNWLRTDGTWFPLLTSLR